MCNKVALLVLDRGFYHFQNVLWPIAKKLHENLKLDSVLVTFSPTECNLEKLLDLKNSEFLKLDTTISTESKQGEISEAARRQREMAQQKRLSRPFIIKLASFIPARITEILHWKKRAKDLLELYKPCVILMQKGNREEVPFLISEAKKRGVATIALQTNWGAIKAIEENTNAGSSIKFIDRLDAWLQRWVIHGIDLVIHFVLSTPIKIGDHGRIKTKGSAQIFAIESDMFCLPYMQNGVKKQQLIVTGAPESDDFFRIGRRISKNDSEEIRNHFDIPLNADILMFNLTNGLHFTQAIQEKRSRRLTECLNFLNQEFPDLYIWLSVHPRDNARNYESIVSVTPRLRIVEETSPEMYFSSTLMVSEGSTSVMYSEWAGKPTAIYPLVPAHGEQAAQVFQLKNLRNLDDLANWIVTTLSSNSPKSSIKWISCMDGRACDRISRLVEDKLLSEG
jgi:hypothetical protein